MACPSCLSRNQVTFLSEINIHFPGSTNWAKPAVLVFPTTLVCLDCGASLFTIPKDELARLAQTQKHASGVAA